MAIDLAALREELDTLGLSLRGILPAGRNDTDTESIQGAFGVFQSILIIGNEGKALWHSALGGYREDRRAGGAGGDGGDQAESYGGSANDEETHRLDNWTRAVIDPIAARLGGVALYPFGGPPWHPFQRWAMAAEPVVPSPIGMLIHPDFGLWHAYRAAILVPEALAPRPMDDRESPCLTCADMPCLSTCPVDAFKDMRGDGGYYDVPACATHIATAGGSDCLSQGCRARRACPVGRDYTYAPGQAEFHMRAFLRARGT